MGLNPTLGSLLFFFGSFLTCSGSFRENCSDYQLQFEKVFTVPGDVVMLNSTLVSPDVFDFSSVPYTITWYDSNSTTELRNKTGRTLVWGHMLWFLNVTMEDAGEYVTIVRTPTDCYRQVTQMVVERPLAGQCGRPQKAPQILTNEATDSVSCPLKEYITTLDRHSIASSITWYRGCDVIEDGADRYSYWNRVKLKIDGVNPTDNGFFTCVLSFSLGGINRSVSETIDAWVKEDYSLEPQLNEPAGEVIKASAGSRFTKNCLVFVPCVGPPRVDLYWRARDNFIMSRNPSDRVYTSEHRSWHQESPVKGVWLEKTLIITELGQEHLHSNYSCLVYSNYGSQMGYFTLLPKDPSVLVPIGTLMASVMLLFISTVAFYYVFRIDIVLWFRRAFPIVYGNTDLDGKLYDAYVVYPQPGTAGFRQEVETFAIHTLSQVLEKSYGYRLFIAGRDCVPGHAVADTVDESICASRRVLLLYDASTFTANSISSNNNLSSSKSEESLVGGVKTDGRQQLECVLAMHQALMEGSLKVVLVELEEITAAQLALLPESVSHLRKKQGAVCLWKSRRTGHSWRTCTRTLDDKKVKRDSEVPLSVSSSSRFWKEMRYHMPVRGKRAMSPEKTTLLHL
ncbi:interleukin-1 receptor-like 2 isoform 1-T2 [Synchiropus picturatus]